MTRRDPIIRASFLRPGEITVDNFAGGGGASTGIAMALGRSVDIAINHDAMALAMHAANHPETKHYVEDVWDVDPVEVCAGRPVGLAWFSPDCKHFSRAKGGKPLDKSIRGLAWIVTKWAEKVRPRVIVLENVPEFQTWGPLDKDGFPIKARAGQTYRQWMKRLSGLGYEIDMKMLVAADYGTPTTRRRLFIQARCDGQPITWPGQTHGKGTSKRWRPVSEVIDWSIPIPSIFLTREQAKAWGAEHGVEPPKRPLVPATLQRIAEGLRRYVIECEDPFVVQVDGSFLAAPAIVRVSHGEVDKHGKRRRGKGSHGMDEPLPTVTGSNDFALMVPTLIQTGYGEDKKRNGGLGQKPRVLDLDKPIGTIVAGGAKHALVAAFLTKHFTGVVGHGLRQPIGTVTAKDHHSLTVAWLAHHRGTSIGRDAREPAPTITAGAVHFSAMQAFLVKFYGSSGNPKSQHQAIDDPLHTITTKGRYGLIVTIHGEDYVLVDICMRMLQPRELFDAQGFPEDFIIDVLHPEKKKPLTKAEQIHLVGNSVPPPVARAIIGG